MIHGYRYMYRYMDTDIQIHGYRYTDTWIHIYRYINTDIQIHG